MRPSRFALALCLAGGLSTSSALAAPITITFDAGDPINGLAAGTILSDQYFAAVGVTFTPNSPPDIDSPSSPDYTWATDTELNIVASTDYDANQLGTPSLVSGNILHSSDAWFGEDGDASFRATFSGGGVTTLSATFASLLFPASTRLFAYNGTTLLATATASMTGQQELTVSSATPITSVVFTLGNYIGDWVAVDNITFTPVAVPEPTSLTLLALGVAAAARSRRRR